MPETVFPIVKEARLGSCRPGSTLEFAVPDNGGYLSEATLFQGTKVVGAWESVELLGMTIGETLTPPAIYTLQLDLVFTKQQIVEVKLRFRRLSEGVPPLQRTVTFAGKKPELARALVFIRVE